MLKRKDMAEPFWVRRKRGKGAKDMAITVITGENFQAEVLESKLPVLLDFWAPWCGPCRLIMPAVEEIAAQEAGVKVCKVNVDEEPDIARRFGIMSIPTLIVLKNGKVTNQASGARPKEKILELLK